MMDLFTPLGCNFYLRELPAFRGAVSPYLIWHGALELCTFSCRPSGLSDTDVQAYGEELAGFPFVRVVTNEHGFADFLLVKNRKSGEWLSCPVSVHKRVH